jgi:superfamily II DNA or RNA helicase
MDKEIELYPNITDPNFREKLFEKKEFNILHKHPESFADIKAFKHEGLIFKQHQIFAANYINPFTNFRRALLFYSTGSGKTLAAYLISKNFIDQFKQIRENNILNNNILNNIPNIKILGFTKDNIKLEFLKFPELGFISEDEQKHLQLIKDKFGSDSVEFINERTKYITRLSNKNYGGYFNFHGYQEIVNKLFIFKKENIDYKSLDIIKLNEEIVKNNIEINYNFLNEFKDTLIICDEIHNIYNSAQINNYGLAILYILLHNKNTKLVGLSATPLNNNPREIVDLINILSIEKIEDILDENLYNEIILSYKTKIKKTKNKEEINEINLKKITALEQLVKKYLSGKILFYENIDLRYYPNREFVGEKIAGISLLPFIRCYMSDYYFKNYIELINYDKNTNDSTLNITNYIYEDIIMPERILDERQLQYKTDEYKKKYNLYIHNGYFFGDFFIKDNLKKYSPKYYEMLKVLNKVEGKAFIYHKYIHKSGVLMIETILKHNGYISYDEQPNDNTLCLKCKKTMKEHKNIKNHEFIANRYVSLTSLNEVNVRKHIINVFNNTNNTDGSIINIIIGSQVIEEGIELKAVNNLLVMSLPTNIATYIQVIGRCIRTNSHILLPPEKQYVKLFTFVTSYTPEQKKTFIQQFSSPIKNIDEIYTVDENHYYKKINDHMEIQVLEKFMKEIAVDNGLYDLKTFEDELFYKFDIKDKKSFEVKTLDNITYIHYEFLNNIVDFTILFIKELFLRYKVLSLENIFEKFDKNDFQIQYNSSLIDKNLIIFILNKFIMDTNIKNYLVKTSIYQIPGYKIIKIDKFYILINKDSFLTNDLLTTSKFLNKIPLMDFIDSVDDMYLSTFKVLENKIKTENDFLIFLLSSEIDIPLENYKKFLENSNNKIIKNIIPYFKQKRTKFNNIIGVFNNKYQFIINEDGKKENLEFRGFACSSLKKKKQKQLLDTLNIKTKSTSSKSMCQDIKSYLFHKHITSKDSTTYFVVKMFL